MLQRTAIGEKLLHRFAAQKYCAFETCLFNFYKLHSVFDHVENWAKEEKLQTVDGRLVPGAFEPIC